MSVVGDVADLLAEVNTLITTATTIGTRLVTLAEQLGRDAAEIPDAEDLAANAADLRTKLNALKGTEA